MRTNIIKSFLVAAVAALLLSACATSTHHGRIIPMGDAELTREVRRRLSDDDITGRYTFGVTATAGSINLRGRVPSELVRQRAINIILGTQGVREVVDDTQP